jgi:hypothetical protein
MMERVNSSMTYGKNFCKCHNAPPAQLKKKVGWEHSLRVRALA